MLQLVQWWTIWLCHHIQIDDATTFTFITLPELASLIIAPSWPEARHNLYVYYSAVRVLLRHDSVTTFERIATTLTLLTPPHLTHLHDTTTFRDTIALITPQHYLNDTTTLPQWHHNITLMTPNIALITPQHCLKDTTTLPYWHNNNSLTEIQVLPQDAKFIFQVPVMPHDNYRIPDFIMYRFSQKLSYTWSL